MSIDSQQLAIEIDGPIHDELRHAVEDLFRKFKIVEEANVRTLRIPLVFSQRHTCAICCSPSPGTGEGAGG
jgi:hypothetical protein